MRTSLTTNMEHYFRARPQTWLTMRELAGIGGVGGWRSRLVEVRQRGLTIEWNKKSGSRSAYRFIPPAQDFELTA